MSRPAATAPAPHCRTATELASTHAQSRPTHARRNPPPLRAPLPPIPPARAAQAVASGCWGELERLLCNASYSMPPDGAWMELPESDPRKSKLRALPYGELRIAYDISFLTRTFGAGMCAGSAWAWGSGYSGWWSGPGQIWYHGVGGRAAAGL